MGGSYHFTEFLKAVSFERANETFGRHIEAAARREREKTRDERESFGVRGAARQNGVEDLARDIGSESGALDLFVEPIGVLSMKQQPICDVIRNDNGAVETCGVLEGPGHDSSSWGTTW
jgi:hypothetical protein